MKITFITDKWCDASTKKCLSNTKHNLVGSCINSKLFDVDQVLYLDETHINSAMQTIDSDVVVCSWLGTSKLNPSKESLKNLNAKILIVWHDLVFPEIVGEMHRIDDVVHAHITFDEQGQNVSNKVHYFGVPQDPTLYYPKPKHYKVGFFGSIAGHPERISYLNYLIERKIPLAYGGGQREMALPQQEYADAITRTKININFSDAYSRGRQCKGRVFEVMASKSLLLEQDNDRTSKYFEPFVDYIPFSSHEELLENVKYFMDNPKMAEKIAENGYNKFIEKFSAYKFWENVRNIL